MATPEEVMRGQIVALNDALGQMQSTVLALQQRLEAAEEEASRSHRRGQGRGRADEGQEDVDGDDYMRGKSKDLMSRKFFEPEPFTKSSGAFRDWSEEFVDFIAMRDETLSAALDNARDQRARR